MRAPDRGLAAARLADQRERLAREDREVDAVDRAHVADRALQHAACGSGTRCAGPRTRSSASRAQHRHGRASCATRWQHARLRRRHRRARRLLDGGSGSNTRGQRVWKRQPGGHCPARHHALDLREPLAARLAASGSSAAGPACRDGAAARSSSTRVPSSTIWPAYITATRSASSFTTPRSWRDEQDRRARSSREVAQQLQDLRLDRHVERGGRLVGDQELRPHRPAPSRSSRAA